MVDEALEVLINTLRPVLSTPRALFHLAFRQAVLTATVQLAQTNSSRHLPNFLQFLPRTVPLVPSWLVWDHIRPLHPRLVQVVRITVPRVPTAILRRHHHILQVVRITVPRVPISISRQPLQHTVPLVPAGLPLHRTTRPPHPTSIHLPLHQNTRPRHRHTAPQVPIGLQVHPVENETGISFTLYNKRFIKIKKIRIRRLGFGAISHTKICFQHCT